MANRINLNQTSYHGAGAIEEIANEAKAHGFKKAFVCSDPDLVKFHVTSKVTDILEKNGLAYELYSDIKPNPTIENVQHGVQAFKDSGADYLIAIGGGSSMDTSKAIGIIIANPEFEDVRSLEGTAPTKKPCVPIIAVPTTAGTAAEVTINYVITMIREENTEDISAILNDCICLNSRGKPIKPKTVGQKKYTDKIKNSTIVFGIGPAGTGKTYLAVAMAVKALRSHEVSRIILTRPAVEAGERLGFLPGDLQSKIDPYLRPLYDALYEMLGPENCARMIEKLTIEIAPLAYMRGRTLDESFIILDEAQNTTGADENVPYQTRRGVKDRGDGRPYADRPSRAWSERTCAGGEGT